MSSCYSFSGRVFFSDLVYLLFLVMVIFKKFGSNFRNWPGPHFHIHVFPNLTTFNDYDRIRSSFVNDGIDAIILLFITRVLCNLHGKLCRSSVSLCPLPGNEKNGLSCFEI